MITLETANAVSFLENKSLSTYEASVKKAFDDLYNGTGPGSEFLGWVDLPLQMDSTRLDEIISCAKEFRENCKILVVIGIGGSYLGTRAVTEALKDAFDDTVSRDGIEIPRIVFAGNNLSESYLSSLLRLLDDHSYGVVVISKSGTTTEPAIAFRIIKQHLEEQIGKAKARKKILAITDPESGALRQMALKEEYQLFSIPKDVGGRYSVLSPVGLLPLAIAGVDIKALVAGAAEMAKLCREDQSMANPVSQYASIRNALYKQGKRIEIMVTYCPEMRFLSEWWKQLFGESEGKDAKGIFPTSVTFTTDLHSLGQMIQDGERNIFETVLTVKETNGSLKIPEDEDNLDGLNYLAGKTLHEINHMAELGTRKAHCEGGVPNIELAIDRLDAFHLGQLIYFFEMSCALSGYLLGVNPFDQPGVEAYKRNMFALLGKPQ